METTQGAEIGARGNYDGKYEESCVGETTQVGSYGVCFGGSDQGYPIVELYPLLQLIGVDIGAETSSTIDMLDGNIYGNLDGYPLGEWVFG